MNNRQHERLTKCRIKIELSPPTGSLRFLRWPTLGLIVYCFVQYESLSRGTPITMTTKMNVSSAPLGQAIYTGRRQAEKMQCRVAKSAATLTRSTTLVSLPC